MVRVDNAKALCRRMQFSLRTLMVTVLVGALGLSWLTVKLRQAERQQEAIQQIVAGGGSVSYLHEGYTGPSIFQRAFGEQFCSTVVSARVSDEDGLSAVSYLEDITSLHVGAGVSNESLVQLSHARSLESLDLSCSRVTDSALQSLGGLTGVRRLELEGRPITGAGLAAIQRVETLEYLGLERTVIADSDLTLLAGFSRLRSLDLSNTRVTRRGIRHLLPLGDLNGLYLRGIDLTDESLRDIGHLTELESVVIEGNAISDVGVFYLRRLTKVESLTIVNSHLTDGGLVHLSGMAQLRILFLPGAQITDEAAVYLPDTLCKLEVMLVNDTQVTETGAIRLRNKLPILRTILPYFADSGSQSGSTAQAAFGSYTKSGAR